MQGDAAIAIGRAHKQGLGELAREPCGGTRRPLLSPSTCRGMGDANRSLRRPWWAVVL